MNKNSDKRTRSHGGMSQVFRQVEQASRFFKSKDNFSLTVYLNKYAGGQTL